METADLQALAKSTRNTREAGVALLLGSVVLTAFIFFPLTKNDLPAAPVALVEHPDAFAEVPISAQAAIVYDLALGKVLYEKNADAQLPLASLTKLLTTHTALHELGPDAPITITESDEAVDNPRRFAVGDTLALSDLARVTLTASLNDGATAMARTAAERQGTTTEMLLASAITALGLTSTYAMNGSGLDLSTHVSGAYGSARDVAILAGELVALAPEVALATTLPKASARTEKGKTYEILNTNPTVLYAPRLLLSKTGFTDLAGGNLTLVFDVGINHPIALVVLNSTAEARFTDAQALVAATLAHFAGVSSL